MSNIDFSILLRISRFFITNIGNMKLFSQINRDSREIVEYYIDDHWIYLFGLDRWVNRAINIDYGYAFQKAVQININHIQKNGQFSDWHIKEMPNRLNTSAIKIMLNLYYYDLLFNVTLHSNNKKIFRTLIVASINPANWAIGCYRPNDTSNYYRQLKYNSPFEYAKSDIFLFKMINNSDFFIYHVLTLGNTNFYKAAFQTLEKNGYFSIDVVKSCIKNLLGYCRDCRLKNRPIFINMLKERIMNNPGYFLGKIEEEKRSELEESLLFQLSLIINDHKQQLEYWKFKR